MILIRSSPPASEWSVVLGRLHQNGQNPFEVTANVTNITLSNTTGSNIAVLHLDTAVPMSDYVQPICLDDGLTFAEGQTCWVAGWAAQRGGGEPPFAASGPPTPQLASFLFLLPNLSRTNSAGGPDPGGELWEPDGEQQHLHRVLHPGAGERPATQDVHGEFFRERTFTTARIWTHNLD